MRCSPHVLTQGGLAVLLLIASAIAASRFIVGKLVIAQEANILREDQRSERVEMPGIFLSAGGGGGLEEQEELKTLRAIRDDFKWQHAHCHWVAARRLRGVPYLQWHQRQGSHDESPRKPRKLMGSVQVCDQGDWLIMRLGPFSTRGGDWVKVNYPYTDEVDYGDAFDASIARAVTVDNRSLRYPEYHVHHFTSWYRKLHVPRELSGFESFSYANQHGGPAHSVSDHFCSMKLDQDCTDEYSYRYAGKGHAFFKVDDFELNTIFTDMRKEGTPPETWYLQVGMRRAPKTSVPVLILEVGLTTKAWNHGHQWYRTYRTYTATGPSFNYVTLKWPSDGRLTMLKGHAHSYHDELWVVKGSTRDLGLNRGDIFGELPQDPPHMSQTAFPVPTGWTLSSVKAAMLKSLSQGSAKLLCRIDKSLVETLSDFEGYQTLWNYANLTSEFQCQRRLQSEEIRKDEQWVVLGFTGEQQSGEQHSMLEAWMEFDIYSGYVRKKLSSP